MGSMRFAISGSAIPDIVAELDAIGELENRALPALVAGAEVLLPAMQAAAPVRSGGRHIRDKLAYKARGNYGRATAEVGAWDAPIAYFVEYGHGGPKPAPAHPYMDPASRSVEDQVVAAIRDELMKGLGG